MWQCKVLKGFILLYCFGFIKGYTDLPRQYSLKTSNVEDSTDLYSGSSAAELILRFFGLTPTVLGIDDSSQAFKTFLAEDSKNIGTDNSFSMSAYDWCQTVNFLMITHKLNNGRQFKVQEVKLKDGMVDKKDFFELASSSLAVKMPVVLVTHNKFYVLTAMNGSSERTLYNFFGNSDENLHYIQSTASPYIFTGLNHLDPALKPTHIISYKPTYDFIKLIDFLDIEVDPQDHFRMWYRFLAHNGMEVKMSRRSASALIKLYYEQSKETFILYATFYIRDINHIGRFSYFNDYQHAAKNLYEAMPLVHKEVSIMNDKEKSSSRQFVYFQTFRSHTLQETIEKLTLSKTVFLAE